ncbi:hypothetical protein TWF788_002640 [Orbilia oligospora]|uniref:Uncharacterized protein n=1 Tax=Orbilia oligospora TaxID=2813651 RepID=A0A7C8U820_ORBOL|nr:hypothetical protein TWF788_002640 [Orbilia oligospora]
MSQPNLPVLPAVESALSPFIHPASEVNLIRRHLSSTLTTLIASSTSPTPSLSAQRAVRTLTGTRKAYYNAAVENLRLRKQWAELTADIKLPVSDSDATTKSAIFPQHQQQQQQQQQQTPSHIRSHSRKISTGVTPLPTDWTQTYDQVLEFRRVLSQLTVLGKYQQKITALAQGKNKSLAGVFVGHNQQLPPAPPGGPLAGKDQAGGATGGDEESLLPLEKAVVDAKRRLDEEKRLLGEVKERVKEVDMANIPEEVKTAGMVAAKAELEIWLDEQLRLAGEGSATPRKGKVLGMVHGDENFDLDEELAEIKRVYEDYVESRERMLHAFLLASQPIKKEPIPQKLGRERSNTANSGPGLGRGELPELLGAVGELGYWKERMDELGELMKAMKEGNNVAARELEGVMGKLRSESQLLDNFGGGGVRIQHREVHDGNSNPFQGSLELARVWEAAAEDAEKTTSTETNKDATYAETKLEEVDKLLEQLKDLLPEEETTRKKKNVNWRGLRGNVGFSNEI